MFDFVKLKFHKFFFKIIVWDVDGTLYKGEELGNAIKEHFLDLLTKNLRISREVAQQQLDSFTKHTGRWSLSMSKIFRKNEKFFIWSAEKNIQKHKYVKKDPTLIQAICSLKQYRHFIVTNSTSSNTKKILLELGFSQLRDRIVPFEDIFSFDQTGYIKPDLKAFQQVLSYTHKDPQHHLMIGDTVGTDILPAKTLAMTTALIGSHHPQADYSFPSISNLCKALSSSWINLRGA